MTSLSRYAFPALTEQGRPATIGIPPEAYSARLAFSIEPLGKIKELENGLVGDPLRFQIGGRDAVIERYDSFYVLRSEAFSTHEEAKPYLSRACLSLLRLSVMHEMAIEFVDPVPDLDTSPANRQLRESFAEQNWPSWKRNGTFTDAAIFSHWSCVVPEHMRIWEFRQPFGKEVKLLEIRNLSDAVLENQGASNFEEVLSDRSVRLAVSTFGAAHNTWNRDARFFGLITVLEILKSEANRPQYSQQLIDKLIQVVELHPAQDSDEKRQREQLKQDLKEKRGLSITSAIRNLVYKSRSKCGLSKEESDSLVGKLYGIRSKLVHEGAVKPKGGKDTRQQVSAGYEELRKIVSEVLNSCIDAKLSAEIK